MTRRSGSTDTALPEAAAPGTPPGPPGPARPPRKPPRPRGAAPSANPDAFLAAPEQVPGYRDLVQIGYGGFSVVYRAVQESVDRAVAVKVLTVAGPDEDTRRRFDREVRLAGKLSGHPHVVTVLDTGTTASGRPFLAMDLYDGGSMKEWLGRRGTLTPAQAAAVGAKIADALAAAHELGVLHRDVKPNNILVSRYGEPALADFGVSCLLDSSASGSVLDIFSPQHAAPELMTRGVPSVASDIYALASSLYELLMGRPPFGGNGQDVRATMFRTVSEPAPRADCPGIPGLADAIERAMAKEPHDRFPDAAAFARELRALIPDGGSAALAMGDVPGPRREGTTPSAGLGGHPAVVGPSSATHRSAGMAGMAGIAGAAGTAGVAGITDIADAADMTDEMYVYSASEHYPPRPDDTMVRPDREDSAGADRADRAGRAAAGGRRGANRSSSGGNGGSAGGGGRGERGARSGESRSRKPLIIAAGVALVAGAGWAVISSQGSGAPRDAAAANPAPPTSSGAGPESTSAPHATTSTSATHATSSTSSAHHSSSSPPSHAPLSSTSAPASVSAPPPPVSTASSSGPQLPGTYHRFRNAQSGDCLAQPSGSGTAGHQSCASDRTQGWEYTVPLTGILGAVTGQFELVNGSTGQCLTGGAGGTVSVRPCTGSTAQFWSKTGGSGASTEFQNAADGQCLKTAAGTVGEGPCSSSDNTTQWTENGTV
ncbi:protein kinase domain-containing protein [Catenulispora subtropica]|uniref:non-specific serine/threonine protein kinase n=1 Tax=Catenulispora subtropica TaxID=450798 RepID=A0ABN2SZT7_9ACTN